MASRWGIGAWKTAILAPVLAALALALGAAPAAAYADPFWKPDYKAAKDYARQRHHNIRIIGFTLRTPSHTWSYHGTSMITAFQMWIPLRCIGTETSRTVAPTFSSR